MMTKIKFICKFLLLSFFASFLINCGGGGGGGGGITYDYTTEYNNQPGLAMIGANTANDAGYTGAGVKVSVVDTGIETSHSEFSGKSFGGNSYFIN